MNNANSGAGSLRQAVIDACAGGTITFAGSVTSPITLTTGEIGIAKDLIIQGPGAVLLTISGNHASRVFNISGAADVTLSGLTIADGRSTAFGGGITITSTGTVNIVDSTISDHVSVHGGGISKQSATGALNVVGVTVSGNSATGALGGGIYYQSTGKLTILDSTFSNNTAIGSNAQGGGIFFGNPAGGGTSTADISNSTFSGNSAISTTNFIGVGGGIAYNSGGVFSLSNSTIVGNSSSGSFGNAGGVDALGGGVLTVTNTTITGNSASTSDVSQRAAGGIKGPNVTIRNSIVALNTVGVAGPLSGPDVTGPFTSQGYNLIGIADGSTSFNAPGDQAGTAASPLDPVLAPLADNGGPTLTETPLPGSPAIDGGDPAYAPPPAFDQRGFVRVFSGRIDIGAVEFGSVGVVTKPATSLGAGTATLNGLAYRSDLPADVQFRFGTDPTLTVGTDLSVQSIVAGSGPVAVSQAMSGLDLDTKYYFQLILTNASGRYQGRILSFILGASISVEQPAGNVLADGATVNFSDVAEHTTSPTKTFIIRNTGDFPLTNLSISVDGAHSGDYSVSALGVTTVAPGARITFSVSFTPGATGARNAAIHIASNVAGPTNPFDIALTGTGVGATIWTGPPITFTHYDWAGTGHADRLTPLVWLTRDYERGIFNAVSEASYRSGSPAGTRWAYGTTANLGALVFQPWVQWADQYPPGTVGNNAVLHLINENIYIDIRFTSWTEGSSGGGFSYVRSTPGVTNQSPVARCKNVTVSAAANSCSANASVNDGSSDPDAGDTITVTQSPAGPYALGDTTVTLTVTDNHGASSSCMAVVTVNDTTAPVPNAASLPDVTGQCSANLPAAPTATDACDGAITGVPDQTGPFGEGDYTITWTFTDSKTNSSTQTQAVHVHDTTAPSITCPSPITVDATSAAGAVVTYPTPTAIDNCGGPVTVSCVAPSGSTFPIGTTAVTCTATDTHSNMASCMFNVTVRAPFVVKQDVRAAIARLRAAATDKKDQDKLDDALKHLDKALNPLWWPDASHPTEKDGERVFNEEKDVVKRLAKLIKNKKSMNPTDAALMDLIARLVQVDRVLALISISEQTDPKKIARALDEIAKGDAERDQDTPDHADNAIEHYKNAWKKT